MERAVKKAVYIEEVMPRRDRSLSGVCTLSTATFIKAPHISKDQEKSLQACCAWTAHTSHTMDQMVEDIFCMKFEIDGFASLSVDRYEEAIQWFVDFDMRKLLH